MKQWTTTFLLAAVLSPLVLNAQTKTSKSDKLFNKYIDSAYQCLSKRDYYCEKLFYVKALKIKPNLDFVKNRLAEIESTIIYLANAKKYFQIETIKGDSSMRLGQYENAKWSYRSALNTAGDLTDLPDTTKELFAKIKHLQTNIEKIDSILWEKELVFEGSADEKYKSATTKGDLYFKAGILERAKDCYRVASNLKPNEQYPKEKICEIDKNLKGQFDSDKQLNDIIIIGDSLFLLKKYGEAKVVYVKASQLRPSQKAPKERILSCDKMFANEASYKDALAKADGLFLQKKYEEAKLAYANVLKIKPTEQYPKNKIAECDKLLNEGKK